MKSGVIVKVYKDHSVVLADKQYFRVINKDGMGQGQLILFTESDLYERVDQKTGYKRYLALAASLIIMISIGLSMNRQDVSSYVIVDINPSVRLELDSDELVIAYEALNEDAETLDLDAIEGMSVELAVEHIAENASQAGFLNLDDLEDDYILITTVSEEDEEDVEALIRQYRASSDIMKRFNIAISTADEEQMNEAEEEKVVLGLYVASEDMDNEDLISVKSYFSDESLAEAFEEYGTILEEDYGHIIERVNNNLSEIGIDPDLKQEIMDVFIASKDEFFDAKALLKNAQEAYKQALLSDDEEKIASAKEKLLEAEAYKDKLEAYKDDVEKVKELLLSNLDDSSEELEDIIDEMKKTREAEKDAEDAEREAEKDAKEEEREAEKDAKEEEREAEKDAKEEEREAEKDAKEKEREAEKNTKEAELEAEKNEKEVERETEKNEKETEKGNEKENKGQGKKN